MNCIIVAHNKMIEIKILIIIVCELQVFLFACNYSVKSIKKNQRNRVMLSASYINIYHYIISVHVHYIII